jgi:hypothetical protein
MGAELCTITTVNTNHGLINFFIPENGTNQASIFAITTADARCRIKSDSTTIPQFQRICWTYLSTRRVIARTAYYYSKSPFHAPYRSYTYAGFSQSTFILPSGTGKHAHLATNTFLGICD